MLQRVIDRLYHSLPVVRELFQIRDSIRHEVSTLKMAHFMREWELGLQDHPRYGDPKRLLRYGLQVNSQSGEDGIIHEIFRRIGTESRVFVEIGLEDGLESNTAFLIAKGWSGFWIDAREDCRRTLESAGVAPEVVRTIASFVTKENAPALLATLGVPREFDLLSIDIDQNTYYVWEALRDYRPRVAVVEYNAAIPPDLDWKVRYVPDRVWDETQNFGASLKALEHLGRDLGYALVGCDLAGMNAFFVREDLIASQFAAPYTSENHYEPIRYALLQRRGHRRNILDRSSA